MHQRLLQGNDVLCFTRVRLKPEAVNKNAVKDCQMIHTSLKTGARRSFTCVGVEDSLRCTNIEARSSK